MLNARLGLLALLLTACGGRDPSPPLPEIAVYQDRFEFRGETYRSASALAVGLTAAGASSVDVDMRECIDRRRLVDLVATLRRDGHVDVAFAWPEGC
jgi:hypothetical protein